MAQVMVNVRMNDSLKKNWEMVCEGMGLTISTAITMLAKRMTRENRMPFEIEGDPFYSESNMKVLRESIAQAEAGHVTEHELIEV